MEIKRRRRTFFHLLFGLKSIYSLLPVFIFFFIMCIPCYSEEVFPWRIEIEAGYSLNSGNTNRESLFTSLSAEHNTDQTEFSLYAETRLAKSDSKTNQENIKGMLTYDRVINNGLSTFVLYSAYKDRFQKLNFRSDSGGGLKYILFSNRYMEFSFSGALLYEYEHLSTASGTREALRFSWRPKLKWYAGGNMIFSSVLFYQPKVNEQDNYRINSTSSISVSSETGLGLKTSFLFLYDNRPEDKVKRSDVSLVTSFIYSF